MYIPIEVSLYARVYLFHWSIGAVYVCYTLVFHAETHRILISFIFDDSTVLARWSAVETRGCRGRLFTLASRADHSLGRDVFNI